jgi:hypothetical protein
VLTKLLTVDGPGSGLDADTVDGVQAAAFLLAASYTAADVIAKLLTVDGAGSGLDADLLDGQHAAAFATAGHTHSDLPLAGGTMTGDIARSGAGDYIYWATALGSGRMYLTAAADPDPTSTGGDIWATY